MGRSGDRIPDDQRELWAALEAVLSTFDRIEERLDPPTIPRFCDRLAPRVAALEDALARSGASIDASAQADAAVESSAGAHQDSKATLQRAAAQAVQAGARFAAARTGPHEILKAFQSLRPLSRSREILYPLANRFSEVAAYWTHPEAQPDRSVPHGGAGPHPSAAPHSGEGSHYQGTPDSEEAPDRDGGSSGGQRGPVAETGIMHVNNQRGQRGGFSLYVPENYSPERAWPLVVALHGGSGHGADTLWSWMREARSFGFLLAAPTSRARTWSLRNPAVDALALNRMLGHISERWRVDTSHLLLNGISDGGTFGMLLAVVHQSPFTHYAPVAAAVHVLMNRAGVVEAPVRGKRIYMVHGSRDWMFPVAGARAAAAALKAAEADITYREIEDLSHNYPGDENVAILRWFCPQLFAPSGPT